MALPLATARGRAYFPDMGTATKILIALIAIAVIGGLLAVSSYNGLVSLQQATDAQWAQVQNVYQRRADLVPNLVSTVSGAANFEKSTLLAVTEARASVGRVQLPSGTAPTDPNQLAAFQQAQGQLGSALSRLLVVSEQYPDLKATANFRDLQSQLEGTENRIAVERGRFNETVQNYDTAIRRFPAVILAGMLGFSPRPYFSATAGSDAPPKVQFDFSAPAVSKP
jgi:LemA protein